MATIEQCEQAFQDLADRLAGADAATRQTASFDRTLSCVLTDLDVIFGGRLQDGQLVEIRRVDDPAAQIRLAMTSDELLDMVAGTLNLASAWATGKVKIQASVLDLIKLRNIF